MDSPGVAVRPIVDMTGGHTFNEVVLEEVRLGPDQLVGEVNGGWKLAKVTLANERVSLSGEGALWGMGPTAGDLIEAVRASGGESRPILRQRLAALWIEGEVLRILRLRGVGAAMSGRSAGAESSLRKAMADVHGQHVMALAKDLAGARGLVAEAGPDDPVRPPGDDSASGRTWPRALWALGFLFSPALTIGGGTAQIQRTIIGDRLLGLGNHHDR